MRKLFLLLGLLTSACFAQTNILTSPNDITNAAWLTVGTGCTKTNATTYTNTTNACTLYQVVNVLPNQAYTVSMTIALASGTDAGRFLHISTTGFSGLCSASFTPTSTATVYQCTVSSGNNTQLQLELDSNAGTNPVLTITNSTVYHWNPSSWWRVAFHTNFGSSPVSAIPMQAVTHIVQTGYVVNADGSLTDSTAGDTTALIAAAHAAGVKVLADMEDTGNFAAAVASHQALLITNAMAIVTANGYDGINVDWETSINFTNMLSFLQALRTAIGAGLIMADAEINNYTNWGPSGPSLDKLMLLTYDMSGTFDAESWFNSALTTPVADGTEASIDLYSQRYQGTSNSNIIASKLIIGIPFFGQLWQGGPVAPRQAVTGATVTESTWNTIITTYNINNPTRDAAGVPWIAVAGGWLSYDDPASLALKVNYLAANNLGGWAIWNLEKDYSTQGVAHPLLQAMQQAGGFSYLAGSSKVAGPQTWATPSGSTSNIAACGSPILTNLLAWYRADDPSNVCTGGCSNGNTITTLHDGSGNGNNAVNASSTNTYVANGLNGLPIIQFSNTSTAVSNFSINSGTGISVCNNATSSCSVFAVINYPSVNAGHSFVGSAASAYGYGINSSGVQNFYAPGDHTIATGGTPLIANAWYQVSNNDNVSAGAVQTTSSFRLNEANDTFTINNSLRPIGNTTLIGSDSSGSIFGGKLAEVMIYSANTLTPINEAYLRCRWGI